MTELVPCAEMVRFANTGSEAVQLAFRIARGATGRDVIVKFEGHYHGWIDSVFVGLPGRAERRERRQPGRGLRRPARIPRRSSTRRSCPGTISGRSRRGSRGATSRPSSWSRSGAATSRPQPGYLAGLRELCTRYDAILIFDEIVSGFRVGAGRRTVDVRRAPDLTTFAKAMANGFVIGAVAGPPRADVACSAAGPVVHPGTYNGNALVMSGRRRHA